LVRLIGRRCRTTNRGRGLSGLADLPYNMAMTAKKSWAILALLLLVPAPSIGTWIGMVAAAGTPLGKAAFLLSKLWVFVLPLVWLLIVDRERPTFPRPSSRGMAAACATGAVIFVAILVAYWLLGHQWIDAAFMREKAREVGLETPVIYLLGALYWCTVNSILEEYVWRWFVLTRCEAFMPQAVAVIASGLLFTLHHVIALDVYFDWRITTFGSLGVFLGGTTWSWLYLRYRNIWAAYASHVFADVVIFTIGWWIIFG